MQFENFSHSFFWKHHYVMPASSGLGLISVHLLTILGTSTSNHQMNIQKSLIAQNLSSCPAC